MICFNAESITFRIFEYDLSGNPIDTGIDFSLNSDEIKDVKTDGVYFPKLAAYMLKKVYGFSDRVAGYICQKDDDRVDFYIQGYSTETRLNTKYRGLKRII
jgi:hypothetical protein